jgi:starch phosphorylase
MPLVDSLLKCGDNYLILADFRSYIDCQNVLENIYQNDSKRWTRMSILNVANMGYFSSDRTINEYAEDIWNLKPIQIHLDQNKMNNKS